MTRDGARGHHPSSRRRNPACVAWHAGDEAPRDGPYPSGRRSSTILGPVPGAVGTIAHLRPGRPALPRHVRDPAETAGSCRQFSGRARPGSAAFDGTDAMHSSSQKEGPCSRTSTSLALPPEPGGPRRPPTKEAQPLQVPELMRRVAEQAHVDEGEARRAVTAVLRTTREAVNPGGSPRRTGSRRATPSRLTGFPTPGPRARGQVHGVSCVVPARGHIRISADRRDGPGPGVMDARGAPTLPGRCVARWQGRDGLDDSLTVPARAVLL
jgi:hypothetical protein